MFQSTSGTWNRTIHHHHWTDFPTTTSSISSSARDILFYIFSMVRWLASVVTFAHNFEAIETRDTTHKHKKNTKKHISGWWWNRLVNHTFIHTINTDSRCLHDITQRCHSSLQLQPKLRNFGCDRCIPGRSWLLPWWPMGPEKNRVSWYIESTYKAVQQF